MKSKEIWKDIDGTDGLYRISNLGRIWAASRMVRCRGGKTRKLPDRYLKTSSDKHGYRVVTIQIDRRKLHRKVHRLLAIAFIPNPNRLPQVEHINHITFDNRLENLAWSTHRDNIRRSAKDGRMSGPRARGSEHGMSILNEEQVYFIKVLLNCSVAVSLIAQMHGVSRTTIGKIKSGKNWKHIQLEESLINLYK